MATITTEVYGFEGSGATLKEARAAAQDAARAAMSGSYEGRAFFWRGILGVMTRQPCGWGYRFVHVEGLRDGKCVDISHCSCFSGGEGVERVWAKMLDHLAQAGQTIDDEEAPEFIRDKGERADFLRRRKFMAGCRAAQAAGLSYSEVHAAGCAAMLAA